MIPIQPRSGERFCRRSAAHPRHKMLTTALRPWLRSNAATRLPWTGRCWRAVRYRRQIRPRPARFFINAASPKVHGSGDQIRPTRTDCRGSSGKHAAGVRRFLMMWTALMLRAIALALRGGSVGVYSRKSRRCEPFRPLPLRLPVE
jgi:hypothetical protein